MIALACIKPPAGYARWSLRLLEKQVLPGAGSAVARHRPVLPWLVRAPQRALDEATSRYCLFPRKRRTSRTSCAVGQSATKAALVRTYDDPTASL